jgi:3-deoxy-manno-octulosonate cytidylyltransferase (CMP-KDO synthetase)
MMRCAAIIPCRFASTRFPGKPLADIAGKPMMWHVYQRVQESGAADSIHIATDDDRIAAQCRDLGLNFLMTSSHHFTGTDRVAEAALQVDADCIVNVQGDEPLINPTAISAVVEAMKTTTDQSVAATNGFAIIDDLEEINSSNVVKVVTSQSGLALAYSRLPIPYSRGEKPVYRRQLGLYCFRRSALDLFSRLAPGENERAESVEMLRFLEADYKVRMVQVIDDSIPVDTPEDLERVRATISKRLMKPN